VLPLACVVGFGLDLRHARHVCGLALREGAQRADGSLDRTGFLGGAANIIKSAARIQAHWLAEARARESTKGRRRSCFSRRARATNSTCENS
jgi:hypothetical protein